MARTDDLRNYLTDVANSIRTKKGTTDKIIAENFDNEINGISGGLEINGIIKEYQVAAGENVSAGDFVEFVGDNYTKYTPVGNSVELDLSESVHETIHYSSDYTIGYLDLCCKEIPNNRVFISYFGTKRLHTNSGGVVSTIYEKCVILDFSNNNITIGTPLLVHELTDNGDSSMPSSELVANNFVDLGEGKIFFLSCDFEKYTSADSSVGERWGTRLCGQACDCGESGTEMNVTQKVALDGYYIDTSYPVLVTNKPSSHGNDSHYHDVAVFFNKDYYSGSTIGRIEYAGSFSIYANSSTFATFFSPTVTQLSSLDRKTNFAGIQLQNGNIMLYNGDNEVMLIDFPQYDVNILVPWKKLEMDSDFPIQDGVSYLSKSGISYTPIEYSPNKVAIITSYNNSFNYDINNFYTKFFVFRIVDCESNDTMLNHSYTPEIIGTNNYAMKALFTGSSRFYYNSINKEFLFVTTGDEMGRKVKFFQCSFNGQTEQIDKVVEQFVDFGLNIDNTDNNSDNIVFVPLNGDFNNLLVGHDVAQYDKTSIVNYFGFSRVIGSPATSETTVSNIIKKAQRIGNYSCGVAKTIGTAGEMVQVYVPSVQVANT